MPALDRIVLGAPGVTFVPPLRERRLVGERMDVCAFVGLAPRGPCRAPLVDSTEAHSDDWRMVDGPRPRQRSVPVAVESFDEYRAQFGGAAGPFAGPGLLPYAVASFFEQGGRRAYIVRVVHAYGDARDDAGAAAGRLVGVDREIRLRARSEGSWGDSLRAEIGWMARPLAATAVSASTLTVSGGAAPTPGALLRLHRGDGSKVLRFVRDVAWQDDPQDPVRHRVVTLDGMAGGNVDAVDVVEAHLTISDGAGTVERFAGLGLSVRHVRWVATVLARSSGLVWPEPGWAAGEFLPARADLAEVAAPEPQFSGGEDREADLTHEDFFDDAWTSPADDGDDQRPFSGIHALAAIPDLTHLVVPDLYQPRPLPPEVGRPEVSLAGPDFAPCLPLAPPAPLSPLAPATLGLDPASADDLARIIALQRRIVAFVEATGQQIALLDVPPGLDLRATLAWRSAFDTSYAAAYHPWVGVDRRDDARADIVMVPPSAAAAGIVAARERLGIAFSPANVVAAEAVTVDRRIAPEDHASLHPAGVNVYLLEREGVRLTGGRTLSNDPAWRQLSVRRLMLMLRRALMRQMQWSVFEPNGAPLRRELTAMIEGYLRLLYRARTFRGATEAEAFFVRTDESAAGGGRADRGELVIEVGVAPAEPAEFIIVRIVRRADGTLSLEDGSFA